MNAIVTELDDISDVMLLGLNLGILMSALDRIKAEYPSPVQQKTEIVYLWLKRKDVIRQKQGEHPTVGELIDAVARLNVSVSRRIRHKYRYRLNPTLGERIYCTQC